MSVDEGLACLIVTCAILLFTLRPFVPALQRFDEAAIVVTPAVVFYLLNVLDLRDLGRIPWNLVLLFGGALSLGQCFWDTGAAHWVAVHGLRVVGRAPWLPFVLGAAFVVAVLTNAVINVAVIALCLPVALVAGSYAGASAEIIVFALLAAAGMPFLSIVGAAPSAIAHESGQFTPSEFFAAGVPATIVLMLLLGVFVWIVWPAMGMTVQVP
jgi:sodium-dependent dicarboxylate transporter 2/3/5